MKKENLLILFSKWPKKGCSKSRIASSIGQEYIEEFCFACLNDLLWKIRDLPGIDLIVVPNTSEESCLFTQKYHVISLSLEHLGIPSVFSKSEVFKSLFNYFLNKYKKVVLIPMDIPHIDTKVIEKSFSKLETHEQVFGPEINGGVYLMGLRNNANNIFDDIRWSTENSFKDLIANCSSPAKLNPFFDLNTIKDISYLNHSLLQSCPKLRKFIKSLAQEIIIMRKGVISL